MLTKGQKIYRFKFDVDDNTSKISKHTFEIVDVYDKQRVGTTVTVYVPKCIEFPNIKYKDNTPLTEDEFNFNIVRPAGKSIYVLLKDDDESAAKSLVAEYFETQIQLTHSKLSKLEQQCRNLKFL